MNRKCVIILTILSIILSVAMMAIIYYGWARFALLHLRDTETFAKGYSALPKSEGHGRVVIAMYATPEDMGQIAPTLNSILDQTVKVDDIILVVNKPDVKFVPERYKRYLNVLISGRDYGEAVVPVLTRETDSDTVIIRVHSGFVYGKDVVETALQSLEEYPEDVITAKGELILVRSGYFDSAILEGKKGSENNNNWFISYLKPKHNKIRRLDDSPETHAKISHKK